MAHIKRALHSRKRKKVYFKAAKGYRGGRRRLWRTVKDAVDRSREYSYRDRKSRKRDFRRIWVLRINAAVRQYGISYSSFIHTLKTKGIEIDRKSLSNLAVDYPDDFLNLLNRINSDIR